MRPEKPIRAQPRLPEASPVSPLKRFQRSSDLVLSRPFKDRSASSFHASLLQAIDGVMSLALFPQVVFQVPQHFISSET